jgi:hypothetical protein
VLTSCTCGSLQILREATRSERNGWALRWARPCQHISVDPYLRKVGLLPPRGSGGGEWGPRARTPSSAGFIKHQSTKTACNIGTNNIQQGSPATNQQDRLGSAGLLERERTTGCCTWMWYFITPLLFFRAPFGIPSSACLSAALTGPLQLRPPD